MPTNTTFFQRTLLCIIALSSLSSFVHNVVVVNAAATEHESTTKTSSTTSQIDANASRRERNLDHWDAPTLAAYLGMDHSGKPLPPNPPTEDSDLYDKYAGNDAAVMFYAQWDRNSHALAPMWDTIATHINAGSKASNLIMALFDCEKNVEHIDLCTGAGVKHYPTLMFVGAGTYHDTDPISKTILGKEKSAGPAGATTLRRTVKFQGDWQYGDEILDWIRFMQGLSSWHRLTESGLLRFVRNGFFGFFMKRVPGGGQKRRDSQSLPVGVPPSLGGGGTTGGGGSSGTVLSPGQVEAMEVKLKAAEKGKADMTKLAGHASLLIDTILFPMSDDANVAATASTTSSSSKNETEATDETTTKAIKRGYTDMYTYMKETNGWEAKIPKTADPIDSKSATTSGGGSGTTTLRAQVLRSCLLELSLDYCTRLSTHVTTDYLDSLKLLPDDEYPSFLSMESELKTIIQKQEPYCAIFDSCLANDFTKEECKPDKCPFVEEVACRYVTACLNEDVAKEYAIALGLIQEGESLMDAEKKTSATTTTATTMMTGGDATKKGKDVDETTKGGKKKKMGGAWGMGA